MSYTLHLGKSEDILLTLPSDSVDAIVTDPPYELGFMGKAWDRSGIAFSVPLWQAVLRVLKPGGHLLAFSGSRTYHRMTCAIEDAGFEIRDQLMWVYGSGFPKSHNLDGDWEGWGTALKPAHEPICMARKPVAGSVRDNVLQHGTGALNIDACRVAADDAQGGTYAIKRLLPGAQVNDTGVWKQDAIYEGEMKPGRWPANFIHDGSEEVVALFPKEAGASAPVTGREPSSNGFSGPVNFSGMMGRLNSQHSFQGDSGSAARFFYCPKVSSSERNAGCEHLPDREWANEGIPQPERAKRPFNPSKNNHPTVKPIALMRWLCRLITPPGGVVLDPFMGSGSTGVAALQEGLLFLGIDKTPEWHPIAEARLKNAFELKKVAESQPLLDL